MKFLFLYSIRHEDHKRFLPFLLTELPTLGTVFVKFMLKKSQIMYKNIYILCLALILVGTSCSKAKRAERKLHRVGTWQVAELDWSLTSQVISDSSLFQGVKFGTEINAGTFTFEKGGTGYYTITFDGISKSANFRWYSIDLESSNSTLDSEIQITEYWPLIGTGVSSNIVYGAIPTLTATSNFGINQEAYAYTFDRIERNEFSGMGGGGIQVVNSDTDILGQYITAFTRIKLKK